MAAVGGARAPRVAASSAPRVAAFSGHRVDAVDRAPPRFPPELAGAVRAAIRERLEALDVRVGVSSAAGGSDLLFLEELLERGGRAHVFLPFPKEAFAATSVGAAWRGAYEAVLAREAVKLSVLAAALPPDGKRREAYARCNDAIRREALALAEQSGVEPLLVAVWNGEVDEAAGSTADAVRCWTAGGHALERIDLGALRASHGRKP